MLAKYFAPGILWYLYICDEKHMFALQGRVNIEYTLELGNMNGSLYVRSLTVYLNLGTFALETPVI